MDGRRRLADRAAIDGDDAPPGSTDWPRVAGRPSTVTRPAAMSRSASRREAKPAAAMTFWIRSGAISPGRDRRRRRRPCRTGGRPSIAGGRRQSARTGSAARPRPRRAARRRRDRAAAARRGWSARTARGTRSRCRTGTGRPGRLGAAQLDDQPAMEQRAHRVVGVDAADPLDAALGHRLPVGDDGERLERGRRQPRPRPRRCTDRSARRPRGRSRARPARRTRRSRIPRSGEAHLEVAEPGIDRRPVHPGERADLAPRQRSLGHEQQRLELASVSPIGSGGRGAQPRRRGRRGSAASHRPAASALGHANDSRVSSIGASAATAARPAPRPVGGPRSGPTAPPARRRSRAAS